MSSRSTFLFADPSFVSGAAHILDFWGTFDTYNHSRTTQEADIKATFSDWRAVGEDLLAALNQAATERFEQAL
jgi:hypothetical protein